MDRQFVYLNFHTEYSSKGTVEKDMCRESCFGDIFYEDAHQDNEYDIVIYRELVGVKDGAKNNACFMTKDELFDYISLAKKIHDFDLTIKELKDKFIVTLKLDAPRIVHRYVLTWLRYSYEYPFNMYLGDAMKLNKVDGFKRENLFNLFNLVGATSGYEFHGDRIHCIGDICWPRKFYSIPEQIKIVKDAKDTEEVNSLFPELDVKIWTLIKHVNDYREKMQSLEYWTDDKEFKKRLAYYKKNKTIIKNKK